MPRAHLLLLAIALRTPSALPPPGGSPGGVPGRSGSPDRHDGDVPDLLSLVQLTPAAVLERAAEVRARPPSGDDRARGGRHGHRPAPRGPPAGLRGKYLWLLLETFGAGLLGLDRMFLGGSNVPMGLMKLLWNIPTLGVWSTIDRVAIIGNAVGRQSSVSTLDMRCVFRRDDVEEAYVLGVICAVSSLVVIGIWLLLGVYLVWETASKPDSRFDMVVLGVIGYVGGLNVAIALSVPLLGLSVPAALLWVMVRATTDARARYLKIAAWATGPYSNDPLNIEVVKAISGEHLCEVEADPSWTVVRLKVAIRSTLGVPTRVQRLVFCNRPLLDFECLRDHFVMSRMEQLRCGGCREQKRLKVGLMQYQCAGRNSPLSGMDGSLGKLDFTADEQ